MPPPVAQQPSLFFCRLIPRSRLWQCFLPFSSSSWKDQSQFIIRLMFATAGREGERKAERRLAFPLISNLPDCTDSPFCCVCPSIKFHFILSACVHMFSFAVVSRSLALPLLRSLSAHCVLMIGSGEGRDLSYHLTSFAPSPAEHTDWGSNFGSRSGSLNLTSCVSVSVRCCQAADFGVAMRGRDGERRKEKKRQRLLRESSFSACVCE